MIKISQLPQRKTSQSSWNTACVFAADLKTLCDTSENK